MFNYIIRRILIAIPILLGITIIDFLIVNMAPGNPVDMMVSPNVTGAALELKKAALGLNQPLYVQYWHWLVNILQLNFGYSMTTYQPVGDMLAQRIGPTMLLMGLSLIVGLLIAVPLGIVSATHQNSTLDYVATGGAFFGVSIPNFFLGLGLIYIFAVRLKVLPSSGMFTLGGNNGIADTAAHLVLPVIVLAVQIAGQDIRYVRSGMLEILGQDYLRTARAKGLKESVVINRHALRNALITIITVIGMQIPLLFGGAVITEQIFAWPGIGQLTIDSISGRDYPTLMAINLIAAVMVLAANLLTDIMYSVVDPRVKYN
ncbi:Glutathione transport system permease protein GsiC [Caprobacter fermentans]|uniref:ABC transporter permease n=1 Tax=Caproicibacter fermentans TaxID=2576756 RepID=A0A6N8HWN9_9FIRM|nr:ABC transporter permease [Caproicibacter fermentans]MVB10015.1 Glutathione transport system permease protein GsiC [Caproicibacter fermentans]OCN02589.1 peptide permease [Clostridium sp. W14A]QNK42033.1 ABC transporter permease [Caproicibacter fermentans]